MGKYLTPNCRRRPNLDPLENRYLLSRGVEVIEVPTAPAFVIGIDLHQTPRPFDDLGSLAISPVSIVPGNWQMPGFHHDFSPMDGLSTPAVDFHTDSALPVVSVLISPISESENAAESAPSSESMPVGSVAAVPALPGHGDVPPGMPPPPGQPFAFPFLSGDPGRFPHPARDLAARPPLDETTPNSAEDTSQADDVTVSPASNQSAVQTQGGSSLGQIAPSAIVAPGNLTALFKPDPGHDDQSIPLGWSGESPGNQPAGAAQGNLPRSGSAFLVTTADSPADGADHGGDGTRASTVDLELRVNPTKLLLPQAAGLIASAVPFDKAALEQAVDQFFDQLESLGMGQLVEQGPTRVIPLSLAVLTTVAAVEVARRRLKSRTGERKATERQNPLGSEELLGFPELPGSWSTNLT